MKIRWVEIGIDILFLTGSVLIYLGATSLLSTSILLKSLTLEHLPKHQDRFVSEEIANATKSASMSLIKPAFILLGAFAALISSQSLEKRATKRSRLPIVFWCGVALLAFAIGAIFLSMWQFPNDALGALASKSIGFDSNDVIAGIDEIYRNPMFALQPLVVAFILLWVSTLRITKSAA